MKTLHIYFTSITRGDLQGLAHNTVTWPVLTHIADDLLYPLCTYYLFLLLEQSDDCISTFVFIELYGCVSFTYIVFILHLFILNYWLIN